jgi:transcriptional regulator with XRE-family HTH domain
MNNTTAMPHQGRNVKRIREILGIKQDALAIDLGLSQQAISQLEQRETLDAPTLEKVAKVLGVSEEAIKNFSDEATHNFISTFNDNSVGHVIGNYGEVTINTMDKWIEALEEIKRLNAELVKVKDEKIVMLERLLEKK